MTNKKPRKKFKTLTEEQLTNLTPQELSKYDKSILFHTYQKMRDKALKRLQRLKEAGFAERNTYKEYKDTVSIKPSTMTANDIKQGIIELRAFFANPLTTVRGQKKADKNAQAEQEIIFGKEWIDKLSDEQLVLYGDFMDTLRANSSYFLVYDDTALNEMWNIYKENPDITDFANDPLMKDAYNKFLNRNTTIKINTARKDTSKKKSEKRRLNKIIKRKRSD